MVNHMNGPLTTLITNTNPYKRTEWHDDLIDPVTGEIIEEGTTFWALYANNIEWGIFNAYEQLIQYQRALKKLQMQMELDGRIPGANGTFVDTFDELPTRMERLTASADIKLDVGAGENVVLSVSDVSSFAALTYATVYGDKNYEHVYITAVDEETITVQALTNSYKKGAKIARSTARVNTATQTLEVAPFTQINVSVVEVV